MAFWVYPSGHDMANRVNLDSLGQLYLAIVVVWTILILGGTAFLIVNRHLSFLRMRNIPLGIIAVSTLHVYWSLSMLAYILNGYFPCGVEYWVMSTFLPLGIALYQANSTQLLHVAGMQKRFLSSEHLVVGGQNSLNRRGWRRIRLTWRSFGCMKRAIICIILGSVAQVLAALILFLMSKRFHASWGVFGHETTSTSCRKGWEWLPSIAWQFTWAWLYAPYLLWKIRGIDDVHGWRVQTIFCSLAGLLGTPMWLITIYVPTFAGIDKYWVPPLWFSPGIIVMETLVIFFPCWQVLKSRRHRKETLDIIAQWETKQQGSSSFQGSSIASGPTLTAQSVFSAKASSTTSGASRRGEMYTMNALEKALQTNPTPLLQFSALKDFSAENICFLTHVRDWKANWAPTCSSRYAPPKKSAIKALEGEALQRHQFDLAVEIYSLFVSMSYSDTPVNLSSAHLKELEIVFEGAASLVNDHLRKDSATPFDIIDSPLLLDIECGSGMKDLSISGSETSGISGSYFSPLKFPSLVDLQPRVPSTFVIPESFGPRAFDNSEKSIKYMVLTNTWAKFVASGKAGTLEKKGMLAKMKEMMPKWAEGCRERWGNSMRK